MAFPKGNIPWNKNRRDLPKHSDEWKAKVRKKLPLDEICRRYKNGEGSEILAKEFNVTPHTIRNRLRENGIQIRTYNHTLSGKSHPMWGKNHSRETRRKISNTEKQNGHKPDQKFWFQKESIPWNKGKTNVYSEEILKRMSDRQLGLFIGEKNGNWKGGTTPATNLRISRKSWHRTRKEIYKRDKWICQICGNHCRENIQCHHIIPVEDGGSDAWNNLTTLCKKCHPKIEFGKLREFFKFHLSNHTKISVN